jgi:protein MpaA
MTRLGRNQGRYLGETIDVGDVLRASLAAAHRHGWEIHALDAGPGLSLPVLTRSPRAETPGTWTPRFYVSAGIHGDEPAGPLAVRDLLEHDAFPADAWLWLCPCLNPTGFPRNTRESAAGVDLNRDYRQPTAPETRAHVDWLQRQPLFDLTLCLHEDWEAAGFYLYELNPDVRPSLADTIIDAVRDVCPIDQSPTIDGRPSVNGVIRPVIDPAQRPDWPEALYLLQHRTRLSYTLEAPSDFALATRVAALSMAVRAALGTAP